MMTALVATTTFCVGFLAGLAFRHALDLYRAARQENAMPVPHASNQERTLWRVVLVAVIVLQIVVGVMLIVTRSSTEDYTRCAAAWQQQFAEAYQVRATAAAEVSSALDDIVQSVNAGDRDEFQRSVDRYVELREQQDADRVKTPLPQLPEQACGKAVGVTR